MPFTPRRQVPGSHERTHDARRRAEAARKIGRAANFDVGPFLPGDVRLRLQDRNSGEKPVVSVPAALIYMCFMREYFNNAIA